MKNIILIGLVMLSAYCCTTRKTTLQTDANDPRLELIKGKWYAVPDYGHTIKKFDRTESDSAPSVYNFLNSTKLFIESTSTNPAASGKKNYYLLNDFLYIDFEGKKEVTSYQIIKLTNDELIFKFSGKVGINEPVLCGDGETYRMSTQPAFFGNSENALTEYVYQNMESMDSYNEGDRAALQFDVNCEGKVCNVKDIHLIFAGSPFSENIKAIIKKMPDWKPGTQLGRPVNFQFKKMFVLNNGKIEVSDAR